MSQNFSQPIDIDIIEQIVDAEKLKELYPKILLFFGAKAIFAVKKCYYIRQDVKKNNKKALEYFTKAYINNYFVAEFFINKYGISIVEDKNKAYEYYLKAARLDNNEVSIFSEKFVPS
ncbi:16871_t:CDS:2 [Cetraspora pellucida]|uniref:16871_t:CDS:1 n=1 Tax=Cetraspora pellucida TaxID=1433469 RepID=A0ACA9L236_9GLOM|nr:16871_t:CDS:2 [Cetraspora pellucida]